MSTKLSSPASRLPARAGWTGRFQSWVMFLLIGLAGCGPSPRLASATIAERTLSNGVRVAVVYFPDSTNASLFTFVPMGLAYDGPDQTQWAHLVEHMVIRSTVPETSPAANAETLADHLRLDWYGSAAAWREGLNHHRQWLAGTPFPGAQFPAEKGKVVMETEYTEKHLATHKFAVAAWNQGMRHGRSHAEIRGAVLKADLPELQAYRDRRLPVLTNTLVCLVGGVPAEAALNAMEEELAALGMAGVAPVEAGQLKEADAEMTWDLGVRHLLLTWPLPRVDTVDYAALWLAAPVLTMGYAANPELQAKTGRVLAGADLITPEGRFFYVSAALRGDSDEAEVRQMLLASVEQLSSQELPGWQLQMLRTQAVGLIRELPDVAQVQRQAPQVPRWQLEANLGLQWAAFRYRHGGYAQALAEQFQEVNGARLQRAAAEYLDMERVTGCLVRPK